MLHIGRGSSGLKAELIQKFKHWRVGHIAVSHQFLVTVFGEGLLEQWFEDGDAFSPGTFRDVGESQGHPFGIGGSSIGIQHDGGVGVLPADGRRAPPRRKDREPFGWRGGNLFYLGCDILVF